MRKTESRFCSAQGRLLYNKRTRLQRPVGSWLTVCAMCIVFFLLSGAKADAEEPVVVVIDPGHGGENLGGEYGDYIEKELTLPVAAAMKEELEKYEGVTVYLTRTSDVDLSLAERVDYAASVDADFLFCLHFNKSVRHDLFGAEVWVPAFGRQYQEAYRFADVEIELLQEFGLYSRGIKTKLNDRGTDYYGILRHSVEREIPCALIEHCHLDQENDTAFYTGPDSLAAFGKLDATAAARYLGLRSETLGVDYSGSSGPEVPLPKEPVRPDTTAPEVCRIAVGEIRRTPDETGDRGTWDITVELTAGDPDSPMLYYSYSYDAGATFSELQRWESDQETLSFTLSVPKGVSPEIVVNAYNLYDIPAQSNPLTLLELAAAFRRQVMDRRTEDDGAAEDTVITKRDDGLHFYLLIALLVGVSLLVALALTAGLVLRARALHKKRRRKRKPKTAVK